MRQIKEKPFVPERGSFIRPMMRRTLKDQLQVLSSKLQAVDQNITFRHAELVSKYCSQGFSNLQVASYKSK
ncbi:hypothetical protein, partial [Mesotoga sp. UBA5847]|uniref:hypothetical protein n=1 Tax=Mesotoga sp. UBA5847 TaxID=1946859 RepID=UPI0025E70C4D